MLPFMLFAFALGADPKPAMLVEAKEIINGTLPKNAKLLDVRTEAKYKAGHVPDAQHLRVTAWSKAVTEGTADAAFWSKAFAEAGLDPAEQTIVVIADDMRDACRAWWFFRFAGVNDVRVFNGTTATFKEAGGQLSAVPVKVVARAPKEWNPESSRQHHKDDVLKLVKTKGTVIDARSKEEFAGGRVPGAKHLEWSELIEEKSGKFKSVEEIKKLFAQRMIDPGESPTCYCQSGGRASVVAFAAELVSGNPAKNYYRSWSEWGSDPATPKEK